MLQLLALLLIAPTAQAAAPESLDAALRRADTSRHEDFRGREGVRIRDRAEFSKAQAFIQRHYEGVISKHTFRNSDDGVVDCVDLLSQPGARRHGLTSGTLRRAPRTAEPQGRIIPVPRPGEGTDASDDTGIRLRRGTRDADGAEMICPAGTVPKLRLTLERITRYESLSDFHSKLGNRRNRPTEPPADASTHEYAHAERTSLANWGAESWLNLWNPYVELGSEFSLSQIWIVAGSGSSKQTVELGWQDYKNLYGDTKSHLFLYSTQDGYGDTGCYNLDCDDFVQTDESIVVGGSFANYSVSGGTQYIIKLRAQKDDDGWWIKYGDTWVGYYPKALYSTSGLKNAADQIDFGGEIVNKFPDGRHTKTDMGSGGQPGGGFGKTAYQRYIRYITTANAWATATGLGESRTDSGCYDIDVKYSSGTWGTYFYFGGEGYHSTNCP